MLRPFVTSDSLQATEVKAGPLLGCLVLCQAIYSLMKIIQRDLMDSLIYSLFYLNNFFYSQRLVIRDIAKLRLKLFTIA